MRRETVTVTGMSCEGCERTVESALRTVEGVTRVDADHGADTVEVVLEGGLTDDDVHAAIEDAGYDVVA